MHSKRGIFLENPSSNMKCNHCDKKLDDDSKFCTFCGAEQVATPIPTEDSTIQQEEPEKTEPIPITNANLKILSNLILQQKKEEVVGYLDKMIQTPEDAVKVIKNYRALYQKDIITELKGLSASNTRIKHHLSRFIVFGIIEEDYPHDLIDSKIEKANDTPKAISPQPTKPYEQELKNKTENGFLSGLLTILTVISIIIISILLISYFMASDQYNSHGHEFEGGATKTLNTLKPSGYHIWRTDAGQLRRIDIDNFPLTVFSNHSLFIKSDIFDKAIRRSINVWNEAGRSIGINNIFELTSSPYNADFTIDWSGKDLSPNALGIARMTGGNPSYIGGIVMKKPATYNLGQTCEVLCQELGHLLGLEHSDNQNDIMHQSAHKHWHDNLSEVALTDRDRQMLKWLYSQTDFVSIRSKSRGKSETNNIVDKSTGWQEKLKKYSQNINYGNGMEVVREQLRSVGKYTEAVGKRDVYKNNGSFVVMRQDGSEVSGTYSYRWVLERQGGFKDNLIHIYIDCGVGQYHESFEFHERKGIRRPNISTGKCSPVRFALNVKYGDKDYNTFTITQTEWFK